MSYTTPSIAKIAESKGISCASCSHNKLLDRLKVYKEIVAGRQRIDDAYVKWILRRGLVNISRVMNLPTSGNKSELITRINRHIDGLAQRRNGRYDDIEDDSDDEEEDEFRIKLYKPRPGTRRNTRYDDIDSDSDDE